MNKMPNSNYLVVNILIFSIFINCIILSLSCTLYAQDKEPVPTAFAPFFTNEYTDTSLMYHYLKLSLIKANDDAELKIKYADSALALGENYGTTDQWIYAKIYRTELQEIYGEITETEEMLKEMSDLLSKTTNPRLYGFYYSLMAELEHDKHHPELQISHLRKALSYYESVKDHFEQGKILMKIGIFLNTRAGEVEEGIKAHEKALQLFQLLGENNAINRCLGDLATMYMRVGRYKESISAFFKVIGYYETIGSSRGLARNYFDIGVVYLQMNDYPKALAFFQQSIAHSQKIKNKEYVAKNYSAIAQVYLSQAKDTDSVIYYQEKALNALQELKKYDNATAVSLALTLSYYKSGDYRKAFQLISQQLQAPYVYKNKQNLSSCYGLYAAILSAAKDEVPEINQIANRNSVINVYLDSCIFLNEEIGNPASLIRARESYATIKANIGDYKGAYEGFKTYIHLRDSIDNIDKKAEIIRLETDFKYAKQQDSLKHLNQLAKEQLEKQKLLVLQQEQQFLLLHSESELRRLTLLNTEADLSLQKEQGDNLQQMLTISRQEQQLKQASLDEATKENEVQRLRLRQQWIMGITLLGAILGLAAFLFYRNKNKQNRVKLELERQISDAMLKSLHAQMNPHFIFNSLASVKSYIAGKEPKRATNYLNNFAALIRRILHSSQEGTITFEEELETIRVYLGLEQERFKDRFSFSIQWHSKLIANEVKVPALFLQPYVENAVWHGIMQLKGAGEINVQVHDKGQDLVIQVTDNGVGIDESPKKEHDLVRNKRKSYGMKLSQQRLAQFWGANTSVTLKNREGASGAVLTIVVPQKSIKHGTT